ncbi:MAG TPA: cupin domain-containing protein [Thermoanaerobaculia bacterium]|nr:cupin domain-containing protein [Thermoanaerobaculia bacterium]
MLHPSEETLLDHAGGQLDLALRAVVQAHLELCAACRGRAAELAQPGGWLLERVAATEPPAALWQRLQARLPEASAPDALAPEVPLPLAVRRELPGGVRLSWWRLGLGGGRMARVATDPATGADLVIGEMPGGLVFPRHEHLGFEHAVVLAGGYADERGEFVAGDFAVYEPGSEHGPQTLDGEACWILFRLGGPVRFRGWRGALQRLVL